MYSGRSIIWNMWFDVLRFANIYTDLQISEKHFLHRFISLILLWLLPSMLSLSLSHIIFHFCFVRKSCLKTKFGAEAKKTERVRRHVKKVNVMHQYRNFSMEKKKRKRFFLVFWADICISMTVALTVSGTAPRPGIFQISELARLIDFHVTKNNGIPWLNRGQSIRNIWA